MELVKDKDCMKKNQKIEPWLDGFGKLLSDEEIKQTSKNWNASTWENYLKATEVYLREYLFDKKQTVENVSNEKGFSNFLLTSQQGDMYPRLAKSVHEALNNLSEGELRVTYMAFWENKSQYQIAKELGISRSTVNSQIRRSIKKIGDLLKNPQVLRNLNRAQKYKQVGI